MSGKPLPECAQSYKMDQMPSRSGPTNVFGRSTGTHMPAARNGSHSFSARILASAYGPITSTPLDSVAPDALVPYTAVDEIWTTRGIRCARAACSTLRVPATSVDIMASAVYDGSAAAQ